jgi:T5SS/PEP-CTERM-associated repeat protein
LVANCVLNTPLHTVYADVIDWRGHQAGITSQPVNEAIVSWFHGDAWLNFIPPSTGDFAILSDHQSSYNYSGPWYVYFGDFIHRRQFLSDITIPGGDAEITRLEVQSGDFTFHFDSYLAGQSDPFPGGAQPGSLTVLNAIDIGQNNPAILRFAGPGTLQAEALVIGDPFDNSGDYSPGLGGGNALMEVYGGSTTMQTLGTHIGGDGPGELSVHSGATYSTGFTGLANYAGSEAYVTVSGQNTTYTGSLYFVVGIRGNSFVSVTNNAEMNVDGLSIGEQSGADGTVNVSGGAQLTTINYLGVGNGDGASGEFQAQGNGTLINAGGWGFHVGDAGTGLATVRLGAEVVTPRLHVGSAATGEGVLTISSNGKVTVGVDAFIVGEFGDGELNINNGGELDATASGYSAIGDHAGSFGSLSVNGNGSRLDADVLRVAYSGSGSMEVSAGADVVVNDIYVGDQSNGDGTLNVTGAGSTLTANVRLIVGGNTGATGTATFSDGAVIDGTGFYNAIATEGGTGEVTIDNAEWHTGEFHVGQRGNGTLIVTDGIITTSNFATIGRYDNGVGNATVTGANADWAVNGTLAIGPQGSGELFIENGASVSSQTLYISDLAGTATPHGLVDVDGTNSVLTADNAFIGRSSGTTARLEAGNNAVVRIADTLELAQTGVLATHTGGLIQIGTPDEAGSPFESGTTTTGNGVLEIRGQMEGDLNNDGTIIAYKNSPVGVAGAYTQTANGALNLTLFNIFPTLGALNMLGDAELDGTLSITLQTIPSLGDSFKIISANNITGQFSNVVGTDIGNDLILKVVYQTDAVLVEAINAAIPGDLDGDGFVGINDLNLILTNWNQTVPPGDAIADANGDNFIGIADLNAVLGNWNAGTPPTDQANIPEPTTLILFFILSPTLTRRR